MRHWEAEYKRLEEGEGGAKGSGAGGSEGGGGGGSGRLFFLAYQAACLKEIGENCSSSHQYVWLRKRQKKYSESD